MVKLGIIGIGRIGHVHAGSITKFVQNATIKAVADPFLNDKSIEWANSIGIKECYKDYKKILSDPEIDAVLVCSSTDTHAPISIEAMQAGKDVFCEKPIDHDIKKIKEVLDVAKKTGRKYQVGFNRRFDHNYKAVQQAVSSGKIGKQQIVRVTSRDPEPPSIDYVKVSGGLFMDMTIHDFDMVRFLSGSDVESVFAVGSVTVEPEIGKAGDVDTAVITMKLANGATAVIDNCRQAVYGYDQRAEVLGTKGAVEIGNDTASSAVISGKDGVTGEKPVFFFLERYTMAYADEIKSFVNSIENNQVPAVTGNDGLQAVLIAYAAKKSCQENRPVTLAEVKREFAL